MPRYSGDSDQSWSTPVRRGPYTIPAKIALSAGLSTRIAMGADTHFNVTNDGIAIGGYDVVAYFVSGKPHRGTAAYSVIWEGAEWHFTNDENRGLFVASPETYAPVYGGFCSMAMAGGNVVEVDFEKAWIVSGGNFTSMSMKVFTDAGCVVRTAWSAGPTNAGRRLAKRS